MSATRNVAISRSGCLSSGESSSNHISPLDGFAKSDDQDAPQPGKAKGIHLVLGRDPSDSVVVELYESSNGILRSDSIDDPLPIPALAEARWLRYGDEALDAAQEEQRRIKAKIKPHVERYRKITGNKR